MNSSCKDKPRAPDADTTQDQQRIQKSLGQDLGAGVLFKDASLPSGSMARTLSMTNDGTENNQPTWRYETLKGHARTLRDRLSEHVLAGHGPRVEMPQRVMGGAERHKAGDGRGRLENGRDKRPLHPKGNRRNIGAKDNERERLRSWDWQSRISTFIAAPYNDEGQGAPTKRAP